MKTLRVKCTELYPYCYIISPDFNCHKEITVTDEKYKWINETLKEFNKVQKYLAEINDYNPPCSIGDVNDENDKL